MNRFSRYILLGAMVLLIGAAVIGCSRANASPTENSGDLFGSKLQYSEMVEDFVKNSATFQFDGLPGTVSLVNTQLVENGDGQYTVEYQTGHPGHGDRTGLVLAEVVTNHEAVITVENGQITSAVCDGDQNMIK